MNKMLIKNYFMICWSIDQMKRWQHLTRVSFLGIKINKILYEKKKEKKQQQIRTSL